MTGKLELNAKIHTQKSIFIMSMSQRPIPQRSRILLVEDEVTVGIELSEMIERMGHEPVGPALGVTDAMLLLSARPVDAAILDFLLRKEESYPVAERLRALGVPFVLATGWPIAKLPRHWDGCAMLSKPLAFEPLQKVVASLLHLRNSGTS